MDPDVVQLAQVLATIALFIGSLSVIALIGRVLKRKIDGAPPAEIGDDRLRRLEDAVDAIAVEVERISEGQRFTAKLLAERNAEEEKIPRS